MIHAPTPLLRLRTNFGHDDRQEWKYPYFTMEMYIERHESASERDAEAISSLLPRTATLFKLLLCTLFPDIPHNPTYLLATPLVETSRHDRKYSPPREAGQLSPMASTALSTLYLCLRRRSAAEHGKASRIQIDITWSPPMPHTANAIQHHPRRHPKCRIAEPPASSLMSRPGRLQYATGRNR